MSKTRKIVLAAFLAVIVVLMIIAVTTKGIDKIVTCADCQGTGEAAVSGGDRAVCRRIIRIESC